MTLIKSISGIRGTIGGNVGENLTPLDAVKFAAAYATFLKENNTIKKLKVVIGRDARISGPMIHELVMQTLVGMGIDVIDLGLSTTPTVEIAVPLEKANGGIILTASHNPKQWNALKLLNDKGEFLSGEDGERILKIAENESFSFSDVDSLGKITKNDSYMDIHIDEVLKLNLVDVDAVKNKKFKVVVDGVNSSGGIIIPKLLEEMGVNCIKLYCSPNGDFPHNPEPLKEHLSDICELVIKENADLGIVVDPDVDRLAFITNTGEMFGEEYTLVTVADYILQHTPGNTVSNLSSSRALKDITEKHKGKYFASAVGEVNVVALMKEKNAIIGGEGNGGIIYPETHYGRDAVAGVALFLTHLAKKNISIANLKAELPQYFMSKNKIELTPTINVDEVMNKIALNYKNENLTTIDGVKIDFDDMWVHLRKSNTEPIIRIYTEAKTQKNADELAERFVSELKSIANI